jgi:iron complex transport system substrate-binding protein
MIAGRRIGSGKHRRRWGSAAAVGLILWLAACSGADPAAETPDAALVEPPRIVSLNPCIDAILVAIAPPEQLLALSHYSRDPASSSLPPAARARFAFTGGTAEEVLAARPDLVLASTFIDPATLGAFRRLGLRVETFGSPATVEDSVAQVRKVARLTGNVPAGERLARAMIAAARPAPDLRPISTVLWQPGQIVPGQQTLIADLLRRHGFASHSAARGLGQADFVALETMLADPPELVLVAGDSPGQRHPALLQLDASRIEPLAGWLINCGGPSVIAASERLKAIRAGLE